MEVLATSPADTSRGNDAADVEADSTSEQPVLAPGEGNSALAWVRPEPHGWNHPRISWLSRDDPEGWPLFALEDAVEGGRWSSFEQYRRLAVQSLRTALSVMDDDLPGVVQVRVLFSRAVLTCSESFCHACPLFYLSRSSRPDLSGSRYSFVRRGTSGTSLGSRRTCLPMPTGSYRRRAWRWRTSAFAMQI